MIDVFDEEEYFDDIGGAVQLPFVDVGLVSHIALVVVSGKQGGSHNLSRSKNVSLLSGQWTLHAPGVLDLRWCTNPRAPGQCHRTRPTQTLAPGRVKSVGV